MYELCLFSNFNIRKYWYYVKAPHGHINCVSGFDKPNILDKKDLETSPNKYWIWDRFIIILVPFMYVLRNSFKRLR